LIGGISLIIVAMLTRHLGPDGYGDYNTIFAYIFLFVTGADLGLYTVLTREISRPGADEEKIIGNIFTIRLGAILLGAVVANIIAVFLPYSGLVKLGIFIGTIFMVLSSLGQVLMGIFQKRLRVYLVSAADLIARIVQLFLIFLLIFLKAPFLFFIGVVVISEVIHFVSIFMFALKLVKIRVLFDLDYWKEVFKIALPIAASLVFVLIYFKIDTFLLSIMKQPYDVGVYSVAYKILEFVIFFPAIYLGLVMPVLSKYAISNKDKFKELFKKIFNNLSVFGLPLAAIIFTAPDQIAVVLGGSQFLESGSVLQILSIAVLLIFFGNLGGHALVALNLQKKGMWIYMLGMVINLMGNIIYIPKYSFVAAAWTTVITEIIVTITMFYIIKKHIKLVPDFDILLKSLFASLIIGSLIYILNPSNIFFVGLISLIYLPAIYLFGGIKKEDFVSLVG